MTSPVSTAPTEASRVADYDARVLATIVTAYQTEFETRGSTMSGHFAANVARAVLAAGISRSGDPLTDQIDIMHLHVSAHDLWFAGAYKCQEPGFHFRDFLAAELVANRFFLDESIAR
ncbi:hypothetical protein [Cryobacterium zhongshanensis]|uniref:Uncharacterized protein n=1 Tax=Cryobacterium zhongshanensis TaxID=2928153 RepID=A0AA41UHC3_9MICO|nr:hypothetical protein [Cryobacterium zhongshanensis]MCI4659765.1 hypothetical protein [Cryobacterium zhongshanensis]